MRTRTTRRPSARTRKAPTSAPPKAHRSFVSLAFSLLLVVGTIALYSPVRGYTFINYDDNDYVTNNPSVTAGLTWKTVRWSLTATELANWHPLTWLSHALDYQLFGSDAGYHHLTSAVIHALNALLLFLLLRLATRSTTRSFIVAALFAWHPYNVQSVAWIAERKNLLCTFFFLLTLGAYGWYARRARFKCLAVVAGLFILALASKPMAVTLPFALLLLDYWPLQRIEGWVEPMPSPSIPRQPISHLLLEKLPLLALSFASSVVTVWAQKTGHALRAVQELSLGTRVENALASYAIYIWKTLCWPSPFALFYPHPSTTLPAWKPILAAALLGAITILVWKLRLSRPYLIVGWLWFLGTLVPVIGIVQAGDQAMADRYAYLPIIGLFVMIVWGVSDLFDRLHVPQAVPWASASIVLLILCFLTSRELSYWQDSVTVWSHALQVADANSTAETKLAFAMAARGDNEQATLHLANAVRLDSTNVEAHVNLGVYYAAQGRLEDGIREFETAVKLTDNRELSAEDRSQRCSALLDLGFAHTASNDYTRALANFQGAYQSDPLMVDGKIAALGSSLPPTASEDRYLNLSLLLRAKGKNKEASSVLESAIDANPTYPHVRLLLNFLNTSKS